MVKRPIINTCIKLSFVRNDNRPTFASSSSDIARNRLLGMYLKNNVTVQSEEAIQGKLDLPANQIVRNKPVDGCIVFLYRC